MNDRVLRMMKQMNSDKDDTFRKLLNRVDDVKIQIHGEC